MLAVELGNKPLKVTQCLEANDGWEVDSYLSSGADRRDWIWDECACYDRSDWRRYGHKFRRNVDGPELRLYRQCRGNYADRCLGDVWRLSDGEWH
jgi:hypothetical protein